MSMRSLRLWPLPPCPISTSGCGPDGAGGDQESIFEIDPGATPSGLTVTIDPSGHFITITADSGSAFHSKFEAAIENIGYQNTSNNPDETERIVEVKAFDEYDLESYAAKAKIQVKRDNDKPEIDLDKFNVSGAPDPDFRTMFTEGDDFARISDEVKIEDDDGDKLKKVTIELTNPLDTETTPGDQESIFQIDGTTIDPALQVLVDPSGHFITIQAVSGAADHALFESAVEAIGYPLFFVATAAIALPALTLLPAAFRWIGLVEEEEA